MVNKGWIIVFFSIIFYFAIYLLKNVYICKSLKYNKYIFVHGVFVF